jgi:hypothetical protein
VRACTVYRLNREFPRLVFSREANEAPEQTPGEIGDLPTESMVLDQLGILVTGVVAVWLTQHKRESWRRWACIFGLLGQPFWFYAAWKAEQWGIIAISMLYTYAWARGIWTYWLASERTGSAPNEGSS